MIKEKVGGIKSKRFFIEIFEKRLTGETTRIVDHAIQVLFKHGIIIFRNPTIRNTIGYDKEIFIVDHHKNGNRKLIQKILRRMHYEHPKVELKSWHDKIIIVK